MCSKVIISANDYSVQPVKNLYDSRNRECSAGYQPNFQVTKNDYIYIHVNFLKIIVKLLPAEQRMWV